MKLSLRQLVARNIRFYASSHIGTLLGVAVASAVLVGALVVGDSVRESLLDMALNRIGNFSYALPAQDRFFRAKLADELRPAISNHLCAAVLQLPGMAAKPDGSARANRVQVLGVENNFFSGQAGGPGAVASTNGVLVNEALAHQLHVKVGDTIVVHVQKPSLLSQEAPLSPQEDVATGMRLPVQAVLADNQLGAFGLQASQASPLNAFVPIGLLQGQTELDGMANLLLTGQPNPGVDLAKSLKESWTIADAGLEVSNVPDGVELRTGRVFLDSTIVKAAEQLSKKPPQLFLTYFVNELRDGEKATPYSMVTAADRSALPGNMRDGQIMIDQWLADDLQAKPGDLIRIKYYVLGDGPRLEEKEAGFKVHSISAMTGLAADRTLLPDFPGIAKAEKTENWDAGFAIDLQKIRPKDEQYWKEYRGTPKAFITLAAGQELWGNRFGNVTSIRFHNGQTSSVIEQELAGALDPATIGLAFQPLRERALAASSQAQDFGGLFLGFSFFLIVAALILLAMLFQFGMEKRAVEIGTLLALGWPPQLVRRAFLLEGLGIAVVGGLIGMVGGVVYAAGIMWALATFWRSAVAGSPLQFHLTPESLTDGAVAAAVVSTIVIWFALRSQVRRPARELLERGHELETFGKKGRPWSPWIAAMSGAGALITIGAALAKHDGADVESFFSAGALLLIAGIAAAAVLLRWLGRRVERKPLSLAALGFRGCTRRPKRSVATVALLASGTFLIVAVAANKLDAARDGTRRSSGTGGFALIGQSSLPVVQDLNTKSGREFFGLTDQSMAGVQVVPLRVHEGDDASCLNLNSAQTPRLLGVDPRELENRNAFSFSALLNKSLVKNPWKAIEANPGLDEIPAIADEASIEWSLHKKLGDTLDYTDAHGHAFKVRLVGALANSILQGNLIIDSAALTRRFPDESGWKVFLIDAPAKEASRVSETLTKALETQGLELTPTVDRLNAFNAVQNTYLDTFQVLGGLGLLLGSAGLGVVVLRNVLERRGELAVMQAVGFRRSALVRLVVAEHAALDGLGLVAGIVAALAAVLPALLSLAAPLSYLSLTVTLGLVFVSGILWTWIAARLALRSDLLPALRNE